MELETKQIHKNKNTTGSDDAADCGRRLQFTGI